MAPITKVPGKVSLRKMKKVVGNKADKCCRRFSNSASKIQLIYQERFSDRRRMSTSSMFIKSKNSPVKSSSFVVTLSPYRSHIYGNVSWTENYYKKETSNSFARKFFTLNSR